MTYFNGGTGGEYWMGNYIPFIPVTRIYCDDCAETEIPLPRKDPANPQIGRHWGTGFKWAPWYGGGNVCAKCGRPA